MDLANTPEYRLFREEVRQFLAENLTADLREAGRLATSVFPDPERSVAWQRICHKRGWAAPSWPVEHGGPGWDTVEQAIFKEECMLENAPEFMLMGLSMCGPCIIGHGTEEQKNHYLPRILSAEDFWCQGYSEPGAGSDLAALRTTAVADGEDYIVNGVKIWTSYAQHANRIFCLVRTQAASRPQQGITFLLIDMNSPGIRVEPILNLNRVHEQNTVYFDNVRVSRSNRVGEENRGWEVAKYLLEFERGASASVPNLYRQLAMVRQSAQQEMTANGRSLAEDPGFRRRFTALEIQLAALEFVEHRMRSALRGRNSPGHLASIIKIRGTELTQRITEFHIETLGIRAMPFQPEALVPGSNVIPVAPDHALTAMARHLDGRAATIYGGSNEIQRGILAKSVLGI